MATIPLSFSSSAVSTRTVISCSISRSPSAVSTRCSFRQRPAAAQKIPKVKIAPLCVFTPPVAAYIACSASMPTLRRPMKSSSADPSKDSPSRAVFTKKGRSASALRLKVSASISVCAPLEYRSTSPGLGVVFTSSMRAFHAQFPIHSAVPVNFSFLSVPITSGGAAIRFQCVPLRSGAHRYDSKAFFIPLPSAERRRKSRPASLSS